VGGASGPQRGLHAALAFSSHHRPCFAAGDPLPGRGRAPSDGPGLGERGEEFLRLKVEGILEAAELFVVALAPGRERHVFGRRTLPEMDVASLACAIQNLWLAARAEGLGMGWVSLFDPQRLADLLRMPEGAKPLAVLCLGHVETFYPRPMLEEAHWASRRPPAEVFAENFWPSDAAGWGEDGDFTAPR